MHDKFITGRCVINYGFLCSNFCFTSCTLQTKKKGHDIVSHQNVNHILFQRQARESQLEQTIQDLNAALVVSRSASRLTGTDRDGGSDDPQPANSHLEARISALELDLQTANSHLAIEKEKVSSFSMTSILFGC